MRESESSSVNTAFSAKVQASNEGDRDEKRLRGRLDDRVGGRPTAGELASILVTERLAACVNVLAEMESIYRWKGQVESEHGTAARHQDDRRAGARAAGPRCSRCTTTRFRNSSSCPSSEAARRISTGSESRRPGDIIRAIPALWIAAIALKVLVWLAAPADDRARSRGQLRDHRSCRRLRFTGSRGLRRSGLLWRVSRKLILSYILVGAVPILLLVTFSLLAFLLVFFDISSYLVHDRVAHLTEQASTSAGRRSSRSSAEAPSTHDEILDAAPGGGRHPLPRRLDCGRAGRRRCRRGSRARASPGWCDRRNRGARAAAVLTGRPDHATRWWSICRSTARWTKRLWRRRASRSATTGGRTVFNTATFLTYSIGRPACQKTRRFP